MRNKELFEKVATAIENEPHRYNQLAWAALTNLDQEFDPHGPCNVSSWVVEELTVYHDDDDLDELAAKLYEPIEDCNTAFCIAGWGLLLDQGVVDVRQQAGSIVRRAAEAFGLEPDEAAELFEGDWSPKGARLGMSPVELAKLAAEALRALGEGASIIDVSYNFCELSE